MLDFLFLLMLFNCCFVCVFRLAFMFGGGGGIACYAI